MSAHAPVRKSLLCSRRGFFGSAPIRGLLLISTILLSFLVCGSGAPRAQSLDAAWSLLWENKAAEAQTIFNAALEANGKDVSAQRGLILCLLYQGFERQAVAQLADLSKAAGIGPQDFLLLSWVYRLALTTAKDEELFRTACERFAKEKTFDPFDRRVIIAHAADYAYREGNAKAVKDLGSRLHRIRGWSILGPFDNTSGSGHKKDFLNAIKLDTDKEYTGKAGQKFKWQTPEVLSLLGTIDFDNHFHRSAWITAYAGTRIAVKEKSTWILSVSKVGSCIVELDGTRLLDDDERSDQEEYHHFEVTLDKGEHTLLIKISSGETAPSLGVALSTPEGVYSSGVRFAPLASGSLVNSPIQNQPRSLPMYLALETGALADSLSPAPTFWHLLSLIMFDLHEEAQQFGERAVACFPNSVLIRHAAAYALAVAEDEDAFRLHMERLAQIDPDFSPSVLWKVGEKMRRKLFAQADSLLTRAIQRNPEFVRARFSLLNSHQERGATQDAFSVAEKLISDFPDYRYSYDFLASYYANLDPGKSKKYRRRAREFSPFAVSWVAELTRAAEKEDLGDQRKLLEKMIELSPDSPVMLTNLAATLLGEGDGNGLAVADRAALWFPYSMDALLLKANIADLLSASNPDEKGTAIEYYLRALALNPGNLKTRDKLRTLRGQKPVGEILPPINLESAQSMEARATEKEGSSACVLLDERRRIVFEDGSSHMQKAIVAKVLDDKGVKRFSSISTGINPLFGDLTIIEAKTLKPDGREIEAQQYLGSIAFQSLAPGDLIILQYESSSWSPGKLNLEFWDSHMFQWDIPCLRSSYILLTSKKREVTWKLWNAPPDSTIKTAVKSVGDFNYHSWTYENVPPRVYEILAPSYRDVSPWLDVSTVKDWDVIATWYAELSDDPSKPETKIKAKARELLGGAQEREAVIRRFYDFVCNHVTYENLNFQYSAYVPEPAADVLRSMYGDCKDKACLLRALLASEGIESFFVLVSSAYDGITPNLPSPRFTHAILALPQGDRFRFLDPTAKGMPARYYPESLEGSAALLIKPGQSSLVSIPIVSGRIPSLRVETDIEVLRGNRVRLRRTEMILNGDRIAGLREELRGESAEEREVYLASMLSSSLVGLKLEKVTWRGLDTPGDSLIISYEATVDNGFSQSGRLWIAKLPWRTRVTDDYAAGVAKPERRDPLFLNSLRLFESETMRITVPPGWTIQGAPEPQSGTNATGAFEFTYNTQGSTMIAHRMVRIFGDDVQVENYSDFKTYLENVIRQQNAAIVLKEGTGPGGE